MVEHGKAMNIWVPSSDPRESSPAGAVGPDSLHRPDQASGSGTIPQAPAPHQFYSKEVAEIFEESITFIARMPVASVDEREGRRFFTEYLNVFKGPLAAQYTPTQQWKVRGGRGEGQRYGFIPSSWTLSSEDELRILTTPCGVSSDSHLAAMTCVAYLTMNTATLTLLTSNPLTTSLTGDELDQLSQRDVLNFLNMRHRALVAIHGENDSSYLKFDIEKMSKTKKESYTVFRFPVLADYGANQHLSFHPQSEE